MEKRITIIAHADNRPEACRETGDREPVVQVMISEWGDTHSISFHPNHAEEIADAIMKAGIAASNGASDEEVFLV